MTSCPQCSSTHFDENDMQTVCVACGFVISEGVLTSGLDRPDNAIFDVAPVARSVFAGCRVSHTSAERNQNAKHHVLYRLLPRFCAKLGFRPADVQQVRKYLQDHQRNRWPSGRKMEISISAAMYIVARLNPQSLPFSMLDIANATGFALNEVSNEFKNIVTSLKLNLPVVDVTNYACGGADKLKIAEGDRMSLRNLTEKLSRMAETDWVSTGRHPSSVAAAALFMASEILGCTSDDGQVVTLKDTSAALAASLSTVKERYKELRETLLERSKVLPWKDQVNEKNLMQHARFIIEYHDKITILQQRELQKQETELEGEEGGGGGEGYDEEDLDEDLPSSSTLPLRPAAAAAAANNDRQKTSAILAAAIAAGASITGIPAAVSKSPSQLQQQRSPPREDEAVGASASKTISQESEESSSNRQETEQEKAAAQDSTSATTSNRKAVSKKKPQQQQQQQPSAEQVAAMMQTSQGKVQVFEQLIKETETIPFVKLPGFVPKSFRANQNLAKTKIELICQLLRRCIGAEKSKEAAAMATDAADQVCERVEQLRRAAETRKRKSTDENQDSNKSNAFSAIASAAERASLAASNATKAANLAVENAKPKSAEEENILKFIFDGYSAQQILSVLVQDSDELPRSGKSYWKAPADGEQHGENGDADEETNMDPIDEEEIDSYIAYTEEERNFRNRLHTLIHPETEEERAAKRAKAAAAAAKEEENSKLEANAASVGIGGGVALSSTTPAGRKKVRSTKFNAAKLAEALHRNSVLAKHGEDGESPSPSLVSTTSRRKTAPIANPSQAEDEIDEGLISDDDNANKEDEMIDDNDDGDGYYDED